MELWIRSQDKECLMKVNRVDYDLSNSKHRIMVNGYETLVGHYETKERALEVLDEIHQRLIDLQTLEITSDFYKVCKRNLDNVYEMPKE